MPQTVYLPGASAAGQSAPLDDEEAHHALSVLRAAHGDPVRVINGAGGVGEGTLAVTGRRAAAVRIAAWRQEPPPAVRITLAQALPKGDRLESILQKSVELGAAGVTLMQTDHAVTRLKDRHEERWTAILVNACKQSGNPWLPRLRVTPSLDDALRAHAGDWLLFGDLTPGAPSARRVLRGRAAPAAATVAVGPEGDFSPREFALLRASGATGVNLGERVLRTDTAAVHLLSILRYEWLDAPAPSV